MQNNNNQSPMSPLRTARRMRGLTLSQLAARMGITPQSLSQYESGARSLGPKLLPLAGEALDVSPAYLSGCAQQLPVYDFGTGGTCLGAIMREEPIPAYGVLYLVDIAAPGLKVSVLLAGGIQFTLSDWQGEQVMTAAQIAEPPQGRWVDGRGNDAIMLGGLPRMLA